MHLLRVQREFLGELSQDCGITKETDPEVFKFRSRAVRAVFWLEWRYTVPLMRTGIIFIGIVSFSLIALAACQSAPVPLPPTEVLKRAIISTMTLETVKIDATVNMTAKHRPLTVLLALTGSLSPIKHAWVLNAGGTFTAAQSASFSVRAKIVSLREGRVFLQLADFHSTNVRSLRTFTGGLIGPWWSLTSGSGGLMEESYGPDPSLIDAYASAIIIESGGLERGIDNRYRYHYTVRIGSGAIAALGLVGAESPPQIFGDLTIDAKSFALLKVLWKVKGLPSEIGVIDAGIDVHFHDQNVGKLLLPDIVDAYRLPDAIFDMISGR